MHPSGEPIDGGGALIPSYDIVSQLGLGARSTIHQVVETATGQVYALKRVLRDGPDDDRFIEQAETEYRVASRFDHPHLRTCKAIHRVRRWGRLREVYVLMEFVEGMTLEHARPNRLEWFLQIMRKVAQGLEALHALGFVHSDVKPNNVILGRGGLVKLIDFGQSCPIGHRKERIQGTPDYIAPEQVRRLPLSPATDVFNLGATMYWVLTDRTYPTDIRQEVRKGGIDLAVPGHALTPKEINPKIPAVLSALVMECCRESPLARPADMTQLSARLEAVQRMWRKQHAALPFKALRPHRVPGGTGPHAKTSAEPGRERAPLMQRSEVSSDEAAAEERS